jgi:hypothetical protein
VLSVVWSSPVFDSHQPANDWCYSVESSVP